MKTYIYIIISVLFAQSAYSQSKEAYNWYFGSSAGMTWNTTQALTSTPIYGGGGSQTLESLPVPLTGSAMTNQGEGTFVMSDRYGNLLFYSDGMTIWNRNHQVMESGLTGHNSSTQSGIIIPFPGEKDKYIAFTIGAWELTLVPSGISDLSYSIIDMTLNGGLGGVTTKNVPLTGGIGTLMESVAAVKHSNGTDYWIVATGIGDLPNSALNVWKVTPSGVQTVCSHSHTLAYKTEGLGYLRFSSNGEYFVWPDHQGEHLYFGTFDPSTGTFPYINNIVLGFGVYGAEFSPSNEVLYLSLYFDLILLVYKWADLLAAPNPADVSRRTISTPWSVGFGALQLGPDGRIYGSVHSFSPDMLVIDNVEDYDNFTVHMIPGLIPPGSSPQMGLPNFPSYYFAPLTVMSCIGEIVTLTASLETVGSVTNPKYNWYNAPIGGNWLGDGETFTTSTPLISDTVFYVSVSGDDYCEGARLVVHVKVGPCVEKEIMICSGEPVTLTVGLETADLINNPVFKWYTTQTGGTAIETNATFTSAPLMSDTTFYVSVEGDGYCDGSRLTINVKVLPCADLAKKKATLLDPFLEHNGTYPNPVSVLHGERIKYEITATNANAGTSTLTITDTLPAYLNYRDGTADNGGVASTTTGLTPNRRVIKWSVSVPGGTSETVSFEATPESGASASQPLFINSAWVGLPGLPRAIPTNSTFHQGAGISIMTFSAGFGGSIYNAGEQALDYMTTPSSGVLIVPDEGYAFAGWSHSDYVSLRGATIAAQDGIMHYDTLTVYGNIELHANFVPLEASLDDEQEEDVTIKSIETEDKVWAVKDELYMQISKVGSVVRIHTLDGNLSGVRTIVSPGISKMKLPRGIYIVTINNNIGKKVRIE